MKWYKHVSDSLDDPFIFDLITRFGGDGYMVFFGILEIYSREFKPEDKWKLNVTRAQLRAKLQKRQDTLVINCLKHIQNSGKWEIEITEKDVIIFIPKFTELLDEWSRRKLGSYSGVTPKILKTDKDKELDIDKDIKKGKFPSKVFKSPAIEEISTYCKERNNTINPQTFIDHYTGNGWMVGKNKMKDWKAVIRTWETRGENYGAGTNRISNGGLGIPKEYIPESRLLPSDEEIKRGFEEIQKIKNSIGQNPIKGGS